MTAKERSTLLGQAGKLYTLGRQVERRRADLRRLVEKKVPYDSPQMIAALDEFEAVDKEWKRLEQAHLLYRAQFAKKEDNF